MTQQHLQPLITEIVKAVDKLEIDTVRECFLELTQIQAIYVAAEVSQGLANRMGGSKRLADCAVDDFELNNVSATIIFSGMIGDGKFDEVFRQISCEPRSLAVGFVAALEDRRPGTATKFMAKCVRILANDQVEEVIG